MKIIQYDVVKGYLQNSYKRLELSEDLEWLVNEKLSEGWQVYGTPWSEDHEIYQAIVKYEEQKEAKQ